MSARNKSNRHPKSTRACNRRLARKQANALHFDTLEPRQLLAAITVGNATDVVSLAADTSSISALVASDGGDGISLREAIAAANSTAGEDTVAFDGTVFTGGSNSVIRLTQGELLITDSVHIDGSSVGGVVITGDADGDDATVSGTAITDVSASFGGTAGAVDDLLDDNSRVLHFPGSTGNLTLSGLTVTGGRTTEEGSGDGGGIRFNTTGALLLNQSTVSGNSTAGDDSDGGGIRANSAISISLVGSTVSDNSTTGRFSRGGGIRSFLGNVSLVGSTVSGNSTTGILTTGGGISIGLGSVSLVGSTVSGNSTTGYGSFGGGIRSSLGSISLVDSTLSGNSNAGNGSDGGGIWTSGGSISLVRSTLSGNSTTGYESYGGGIRSASGNISLVDSTLSGNSTTGDNSNGGGIWTIDGSVLLVDSTLSGNSTAGDRSDGGGIWTSSGSVSLLNSTLSGNSTTGGPSFGGGIRSPAGSVSLVNSTVTGNSSSGVGGGISLPPNAAAGDQRLIVHNSIVAGNTDNGNAPDVEAADEVLNNFIVENSLIGLTRGSGIDATTGTGNILNQSALLGPLADNGGPTQTHRLLPGSPAVDAGNDTLALDENGTPLTMDQRGESRFVGTVDIGAVEFAEPTFLLGDANLNGVVNFLDIQPFIALLSDNTFLDQADIDRDGDVDFLDIAPFISVLSSGGAVITSQSVAFQAPVSLPVSVFDPKLIATVASTVEVPIITETSLAENVERETLTSGVSQNIEARTSLPQSPLVLLSDSSALSAQTSNLSVDDTTVAEEPPVDTFVGPVAFAPVKYNLLGARSSNLRGSESGRPSVIGPSLAGDSERFEFSDERRDKHRSANVAVEQSFSTAAELFDADPESLDEVFDFEIEDNFASLIQ